MKFHLEVCRGKAVTAVHCVREAVLFAVMGTSRSEGS